MGIRSARRYLDDRILRTAKPHRLLDPAHGPLIAVRLNILTRKTLGGFETDLDGRVFAGDGSVIPGLFAAGEASGVGGGGMHGYRSLEGPFLGGCLFSGRQAGRAAAREVQSPQKRTGQERSGQAEPDMHVTLITGASQAIGAEIARQMALAGRERCCLSIPPGTAERFAPKAGRRSKPRPPRWPWSPAAASNPSPSTTTPPSGPRFDHSLELRDLFRDGSWRS